MAFSEILRSSSRNVGVLRVTPGSDNSHIRLDYLDYKVAVSKTGECLDSVLCLSKVDVRGERLTGEPSEENLEEQDEKPLPSFIACRA